MSEPTILYAGMFCFALVLIGVALTVYEFHKLSSREKASSRESVSALDTSLAAQREARAVALPVGGSKQAAIALATGRGALSTQHIGEERHDVRGA